MTTNYCNYCWREAEKTTSENREKVEWCAYHYIEIAVAPESEDSVAEKLGYDSAKQVRQEYNNQEEPALTFEAAISLVNKLTDPRGGSEYPDKEAVVYSDEIKERLQEKAQELSS